MNNQQLPITFNPISIYNLGYSLEQTCRIIQVRSQKVKVKSASQNSKLNADGTEFPCVTEQASFVSEASGGTPSDPSRGIDRAPASTFDGDGLSTNIISPTDSSATPASNYQSNTASANMSSINLQPSTLANWIAETEELCRFCRMREHAKYHEYKTILANEHECTNRFANARI